MELDYWFAVPPAERHRVSELLPNPDSVTGNAIAQGGENKIGRAWRILPNPDVIGVLNDPQYAGEVMPSGFGRGNARAMGRLFAALSLGGTLDGFRVLSPETLRAAAFQARASSESGSVCAFATTVPPDAWMKSAQRASSSGRKPIW